MRPAEPGVYRNVSGAAALAWGLIAASVRSGLPLFYASYPITPASELLHELSRHKNFGVRTIQAEDEIAAANLALGAAFGGHLGVTGTSGPGMDLKAETIGLAVMLELPMVIVDVQRSGPSTGMPTKNEAADLLMAMHGRHGESPIPIVAPFTPAQCFDAAIEAVPDRDHVPHAGDPPSDTFLGNSSEPWQIPDVVDLPTIDPAFAAEPNSAEGFLPYLRDENLARPWAVPGTPGLEHRIGGLEKEDRTGNISYDPENHELMTRLRAGEGRAGSRTTSRRSRSTIRTAPSCSSSAGARRSGRSRRRPAAFAPAAATSLRPTSRTSTHSLETPARCSPTIRRILVPELNTGQLVRDPARRVPRPRRGATRRSQGQPFRTVEIEQEIERRI